MAKKQNKHEEVVKPDNDDGIDPADLADDLIVDGGEDLTKEPPENLEDIEVDEDLDLSNEGLEDLDAFEEEGDELVTEDPYAGDFYPYGEDDDSDSY
jgi:hypothetical protein